MEATLDALLPWKGALVLAWLVGLFGLERVRPAAARPASDQGLHRLGRNLAFWLVNAALSPLIVLPVAAWASQHHLGWRPDWLRGPPGLLFDLVVLDFLIFWWHWANHRVPFLWRFHEVHHLDQFLDSTTAVRFHFGEVVLSALARAGAIVVLDLSLASVVVFEILVLVGTIFHHSNLALPPAVERALARIVITPSIHWVHHHARRRDTDSNYGTIFSFWDPLFGTRSPTPRSLDMAIGVEGRPEQRLPHLIVRPFLNVARRAGEPRNAGTRPV